MSTDSIILGVIALLLVVIAVVLLALLRKQWTNQVDVQLSAGIDEAIERLNQSVQHHVDVNAVLGMIKTLDEHPGAIEQLQEYPEAVRAAAWLHYINTLGRDLQQAQKGLSDAHQGKINYGIDKERVINEAQGHVDSIRVKLDTAIAASGQKLGPRAV